MHSIFDPQTIALLVAVVVSIIVLALALAVVRAIWIGDIRLTYLLSESSAAHPGTAPAEPPKASLSRFQFLVFTFVIAGLYLVLSLETGTLIEVPNGALVLLGISSATYAAGKAMSDKKDPAADREPAKPDPPADTPKSSASASVHAADAARAAAQADMAATSAASAAREARAAAETAAKIANADPGQADQI